jgi:hypothetical protein
VGGGWCFAWLGPPPPPIPPAAADAAMPAKAARGPGYVWERRADYYEDTPVWWLYLDGEPLGVLLTDGTWHAATGPDSYDPEAGDAPEGIPSPTEPEPTAGWNQGVVLDKVPQAYRYWVNDCECSRAKAFAAASDPGPDGLVDDSDRYHLSIVAEDAGSYVVPERYKRRLHVQFYKPTDWPAKDRLRAAVTLQEPAKIGGKIVGSGTGPADVQRVLGAVFDMPDPVKPDPKPDDKNKPDDTKPSCPNKKPGLPGWLQAVLAAVLAWLGLRYARVK